MNQQTVRRYAALSRSIGLLVLPALMVNAAQQPFAITPSAIADVAFEGPSSSAFEVKVAQMGGTQFAVQPFLPFSAVVKNSGARAVLLYVIRLEYNDGLRTVVSTQVRDYRSSDMKLKPGDVHLITAAPTITHKIASNRLGEVPSSSSDQGSFDLLAKLHKSSSVKLSLDAVVFEDMRLEGPDLARSFDVLNATVAGEMELLRELQQMGDANESLILQRLSDVGKEFRSRNPSPTSTSVTATRSMRARLLAQLLERQGKPAYVREISRVSGELSKLLLQR